VNVALLAVGALLLATGGAVVAAPGRFRRVLTWFVGEGRYGIAVLGRLGLGLVLLLGAADSRVPAVTITLGVLFLLAAAVVPLLGEDRIAGMIEWWLARPDALLRGWGAVVMIVGLLTGWLGS